MSVGSDLYSLWASNYSAPKQFLSWVLTWGEIWLFGAEFNQIDYRGRVKSSVSGFISSLGIISQCLFSLKGLSCAEKKPVWGWGCSSECLPSMHRTLELILSTMQAKHSDVHLYLSLSEVETGGSKLKIILVCIASLRPVIQDPISKQQQKPNKPTVTKIRLNGWRHLTGRLDSRRSIPITHELRGRRGCPLISSCICMCACTHPYT